MKLFGIVLLVGVACAARLENTYLPPGSAKTAGGNGQFLRTPFNSHLPSLQNTHPTSPGSGQSKFNIPSTAYGTPIQANSFDISPQKSLAPSPVYGPANFRSNNPEARANTIRADNTNDGSGNYRFDYETENKISQTEQGQLKQVAEGEATVVQGSYSYAGDDGKVYTVNYIADENGFQPIGEHIDQAVSMTASDAARLATSENQKGYNYNSQGGYNAQKAYNGYQQGYSAPQQGFNTPQSGFVARQQGFNTKQQGFIAKQPGFETNQHLINGNQQGFNYQSGNEGYKY